MGVGAGVALPLSPCVRRPWAVIATITRRNRGLRASEFQGVGVTRYGKAEENKRQHAGHRHQPPPDSSGTNWIYGERREHGFHVLALRQVPPF
jgi:hypothetical protein